MGFEKTLGLDHKSTLETVNRLGDLCKNQGKLAGAERLYERALMGFEKRLGPDHKSTLETINRLARTRES